MYGHFCDTCSYMVSIWSSELTPEVNTLSSFSQNDNNRDFVLCATVSPEWEHLAK